MHEAQVLHPSSAILYSLKASSNGSLSDSGISDGGCGSDGSLSERERRLGSLRRQAKQLESSLAPGSAALKSIYQRMEAAEGELKRLQSLQESCREAVERLVNSSSPSQLVPEQEEDEATIKVKKSGETDGNSKDSSGSSKGGSGTASGESSSSEQQPQRSAGSKKSPQR